ncbi:choline transporter-like protein 5 isoform X3 [Choloepus didactylus]|uniref:choline transporter-like protein 5 isoform X3 n=1 Tax=Choloepus didactylus TaxID=27675 RepID=UPI0018A09B0C|nr:choline transporter-like protein 5 isoform X3 [Choloepus didactylus]
MARKRESAGIKEEPPECPLDEDNFGKPRTFDPDFKGPVTKRYCTDVLCCLIFILLIIGYIFLGLAAWVNGDPRRLAFPTDSQGHFCGQKGTPNENKTILFYFNLLKCSNPSVMINLQCPTTQVCVSQCPEKFITYTEMQIKSKKNKTYWEYYKQFCKRHFDKPGTSLSQIMLTEDCPTVIFPSRPFLQRCFPDFSTRNGTLTIGNKTTFHDGSGKKRNVIELRTAANGVSKLIKAKSLGMKVFEDYSTSWFWILLALIIAMVLSWIFLILLRFTVGLLFWIFILGVLGVLGYGIWYCYSEYIRLQRDTTSDLSIYDIGIHSDVSIYFQLKQTWFTFMIALSIIEILVILMLIFLRNRIRIAIALLKEGSKAIGHIPSTLFYPILTFIFLSICISYWAMTAVFLATSGTPVYKVVTPGGKCVHDNKTCDPEVFNTSEIPKACPGSMCNFAFYGGTSLYHQYIPTFQIYNLFVFLWLMNFVIALGQCTLAGAFAAYYWALQKPDDIPPFPLFTAFGRAIRYHTGSLAFGSLILALVHMFRIVLEYLDRHLKDGQSSLAKFLQFCLKCCFWCLDKLIKFLNRNAYIMIAIYGRNFCKSARDAFNILMRNAIKIAVMDRVTDFVLFLGKILIAGSIGVLAFLVFTQKISMIIEGPTTLNYYWVPLLTVIIGSYLIAHGFFSVYAMCVDTLFICFLEDLERNDGSTERPYYMNKTLLKILNKQNVQTKER